VHSIRVLVYTLLPAVVTVPNSDQPPKWALDEFKKSEVSPWRL
jgi:hypothetical protein